MNAQRTALSSSSKSLNPLLSGKTVMEDSEIVDCTAQPVDCVVQPTKTYSVDQLMKILHVQRRQVFNYSKLICATWHWERETVFKPSYGRYSEKMLAEMQTLKTLGADEYQRLVGRDNHRPVAMKMPSAALTVVENSAITLDSKIADLQQTAIVNSEKLADRFLATLEQIKSQNTAANYQAEVLSETELLAAENQGYLEAIQIHQRRTAAKQAGLAKLRAMELEE